MLSLPIYLRSGTYYLHTRINGKQFKRSLGTGYQKEAILRAVALLSSLSMNNFNKYKIDLEKGLLETDGTPEDHQRAMSALELLAHMKTLSKPSPTPQLIEENAVEGVLVAPRDKGISLQDLVEQFFKLRSHLSQATAIAYRNVVKELEQFTKIKYAKIIRPADINRFQNYLAEKNNTPRTIDNKTTFLKSIFNFAVDRQYIDKNPVVSKPLMTKKQREKEQWAIFENDEIRLIYDSEYFFTQKEKDPDYYYVLLLTVFTGCRVDEVTTLKKEDFKVSDNGINYFHIRDSKTLAGVRKVPIYDELWKAFKPFFDSKTDKIFKYREIDGKGAGNAVGKKFSRHMGLVKVTREKLVFHSLRKFLNNTFKNERVPKDVRCQFVGHEYGNDTNGEFYEEDYTVEQLNEYAQKPWQYISNLIGKHL